MRNILLSSITLATLSTSAMAGQAEDVLSLIPEPKAEKSFFDRFHLKNDLRLRYESIERDDKANTYRNRYRLRLGAKVDLINTLQFEVGMRSGFANPTSGNQTFSTNDSSNEPLSDYFLQSLRFNVLGLKYTSGNSTYKVGRQPYMMYRPIKSQLVWDNDVSLNGVNYQYKDESKIITLGVNQVTLEEQASANEDVNLFVAQYVQKMNLGSVKLNVGTGLYYYDGLNGNDPLFKDNKNKGNSTVAGLYTNDYHLIEGFAELQFKNVLGKSLKTAVGFVYNFGADTDNFGYDLGVQLGKAKSVGDWQVKYSYTNLEKDATYGAYSDSDNFGGGTDASGHAIRAKYKMAKNLYIAGNFFFNELTSAKTDYERVQLDIIVKF